MGHQAKDCQMTVNNTWPDAETYVPLTLEMALASKPWAGTSSSRLPAAAAISSQKEARNDETDLYVDPPLTVPHLVATLDAFGPNISEFPLSVPALLDIGCPSIWLAPLSPMSLGCWYPLPPEEDNLSSLSKSPISCMEYVKMELSSGNGVRIGRMSSFMEFSPWAMTVKIREYYFCFTFIILLYSATSCDWRVPAWGAWIVSQYSPSSHCNQNIYVARSNTGASKPSCGKTQWDKIITREESYRFMAWLEYMVAYGRK